MSLLALTGMFIFGKKKEEEQKIDWEALRRRVAAKYNTTYDAIDHLTATIIEHRKGIIELLKRADPDGDEEKIMKILDATDIPKGNVTDIYISSMHKAGKLHEIARHTEEPPFVKLVFIQPFLSMALAEHTGIYNKNIGYIIANALSDIAEKGQHYDHLKQNPDIIVDMIQLQLEKLGYKYDKDRLREMIRPAVEKAGKIVDKLYDKYQEDHLKALRTALKVDNPFPVLKQAGIDIEPELKEFRQFLAEISGKKRKAKSGKSSETGTKTGHALASPDLTKAKLEVLSIVNGLEFAGFSDDAKAKAVEKLSAKIAELSSGGLTPERVFEMGLYAFALEMIKTGAFERLREVDDL